MPKRPSLLSNMDFAAEQPSTPALEAAPPKPARPKPDVQHTSVYVPREAYDRLREIAFHERVKMHDLIMEGLDKVIAERGHSEKASRQKAR